MDHDSDSKVHQQLDATMPWVGLYIAAPSAVYILAMVADAFNGFPRKKLWFPCKYTALNASSLTISRGNEAAHGSQHRHDQLRDGLNCKVHQLALDVSSSQ